MRLQLRNGCVDVPFGVRGDAKSDVVDIFLVFFTEPYTKVSFDPLSLLSLQHQLFQLNDHLPYITTTFGIYTFKD